MSARRLRQEHGAHLRRYLRGGHLWSPSYFAGSCGGPERPGFPPYRAAELVIRRGDVLVANLSPIVGHEQGGRRPVLVVSPAPYNCWPIGMTIVAPITTKQRLAERPLGSAAGQTLDEVEWWITNFTTDPR